MPFTVEELRTWVTSLGLPEAQQKTALELFSSEQVLPKVGETIMLRPEFSRKLDELQKEKERLEAEFAERQKKEDQFHSSLATWKTQAEKDAAAAITKAREESEAKLTANAEKIRLLAAKYGVPEEEVKDLVALPANVTPVRTEVVRDPDTGRFVTREQFQTEARFYAKLPAVVIALDREYYKLFGADAPAVNWDKVIDEAQDNHRTLTAQFELAYKIPEKRTEIAEGVHKKAIDEAEKRGRESAMSQYFAEHPEAINRPIDRPRGGSPILDQARRDAATDPTKARPAPGGPQSAVEAATKAYQEGKYKGGVEHEAA